MTHEYSLNLIWYHKRIECWNEEQKRHILDVDQHHCSIFIQLFNMSNLLPSNLPDLSHAPSRGQSWVEKQIQCREIVSWLRRSAPSNHVVVMLYLHWLYLWITAVVEHDYEIASWASFEANSDKETDANAKQWRIPVLITDAFQWHPFVASTVTRSKNREY
jgi:hypothetical protein